MTTMDGQFSGRAGFTYIMPADTNANGDSFRRLADVANGYWRRDTG